MKRFLDKTWTKVAAFILFFVFLGLSVAGGVGIYLLAEMMSTLPAARQAGRSCTMVRQAM